VAAILGLELEIDWADKKAARARKRDTIRRFFILIGNKKRH
jgi:hypothetical protein